MPQIEDKKYCDWIARRAVARAALHLGIENMTEEALHVLASCLLDYLRRIASLTAANAEASGRSTSHCNVLDAIRAMELCTSPSAINGSLAGEEDRQNTMENENGDSTVDATGAQTNGETNHSRKKHAINSWESLAQFCFGVDWDQEGSTVEAVSVGRGIGSKASAVDEKNAVSSIEKKGGWSAPFPEEIPVFPTRSIRMEDEIAFHSSTSTKTTAKEDNPSGLDTTATSDADGDQKMAEADKDKKIPTITETTEDEEEETHLWGILLDASTQHKPLTKTESPEPQIANKKRKATLLPSDPFLPSFYPPIPASATRKVAKVNEGPESKPATDAEALMSVRAALVVPSGLPTKTVEPKAIVPVARASSAPVSRILEGSMDPAQT